METVWIITIVAWLCCVIGWLLTVIIPSWRKNWNSIWWIVVIQVANFGVLITSFLL